MRLKAKPILLTIILCLLVLQDVISKYIPFFSFYDEILVIIFGVFWIKAIINKKSSKEEHIVIALLTALLSIGLIGNITSGIKSSLWDILYDYFNMHKYVIAGFGTYHYFKGRVIKKSILKYFCAFAELLITFSTIFMLINLFTDVGMFTDYRFGIRTYNFIFPRVGDMYNSYCLLIIGFTSQLYYKKSRKTKIFICLTLINMCATLRARTFAFALVYVALYYIIVAKKVKKFKAWHVIPSGLIIYLISKDQIDFYFSGNRARNVLLKYGFEIARERFPLGYGFSTYGTAIARDRYSPLYNRYGFGNYYGLSSDFGAFLTDNYWPAIMGEMGVIGVVLTGILIFRLYKFLYTKANNIYIKMYIAYVFISLLIASLSSSSFFACTPIMIFACAFLTVGSDGKRTSK